MAKVSVSKTINAPGDKVWAMISEWGGTHKWIPGVGPVSTDGEGVGATRSAELDPATGFAGKITEALTAFDPEAKQFSYQIVGQSPIPIEDYVAEMSVLERGDSSCEVTWQSTWRANGDLSEEELQSAFETLYDLSLENVRSATE